MVILGYTNECKNIFSQKRG